MAWCTNADCADLRLMYGIYYVNARAAWLEYQHWYPGQRQFHKHVFVVVLHGLRETGAFMPPAHVGHSRCNMQNEEVLGSECTNASTSTHRVTYETGLSQSAFYHMLHGEWLYPVHIQLAQELQPGDSRFNLNFHFCSLPIHKIVGEPVSYEWTDRATVTRSQVNCLHNLREWTLESPNTTWCCSFQHQCLSCNCRWLPNFSYLSWWSSVRWFPWKNTSPFIRGCTP
jgi:hypothetical protein